MRLMAYAIEVLVWVNNKSSTMILVSFDKINLVRIQVYIHTHLYL